TGIFHMNERHVRGPGVSTIRCFRLCGVRTDSESHTYENENVYPHDVCSTNSSIVQSRFYPLAGDAVERCRQADNETGRFPLIGNLAAKLPGNNPVGEQAAEALLQGRSVQPRSALLLPRHLKPAVRPRAIDTHATFGVR